MSTLIKYPPLGFVPVSYTHLDASRADLFDGASFIVTPVHKSSPAVQVISDLALRIGFGKVVTATPEHHDRMIALTSQLPHVLACSYVLDADAEQHRGFSGGSFRDVSRVAEINDRLWSELFIENSAPLTEKIDGLINNLSLFKKYISHGDSESLRLSLIHIFILVLIPHDVCIG